ncbi:MAG: phosphatidylglycerophosphatase A, partial [Pseudomonadota bacterium]
VHFAAFCFGAVLAPFAPVTWGSLWCTLLAAVTLPLGWQIEWAIALCLFVSGIWICGSSARKLGVHDHGGIVWDEIAGAYLIMLPLPRTTAWLVAGFVVFRVLDIVKPWPIRELDHRLSGGIGIMLDDILAASIGAVGLYVTYGVMVP